MGVSYQFSSTSSPWPSTLATTTGHPIQISKRVSTSYARATTNWMETTLLWMFYHNMDLHTWTERNKRKYQTQQWWAMAHGSHWHIWTYLHQQWTHCNNITNNNSSSTTPNNITMQTEITTLYSNQQNFTPSCKPIFSTPLHTLLTKSHHHLSSWLDHNLPFLPKHRVILSPPLTTHPHFSSSSIPTTNSKNNENSNHLKFPSLRASLQSPTSH